MTPLPTNNVPTTQFLVRPEGRIAYDVTGEGPTVLLVPGMGDLRATYRFLAPRLVEAGYRVVRCDLRGHGESDASFRSYGDEQTADDVRALIAALGGPVVVVGNSMGAGAAVIVAGTHPELVSGLVLLGPWVRNGANGALKRALFRPVMHRRWIAPVWKSYLPKLYRGRRPEDFATYRDVLVESLRRPGYAKAFSLTTRTSHAAAETQLPSVSAPTLVVMGSLDIDFPDPAREAHWISDTVGGRVLLVEDAGHYPQSQQPDIVVPAILDFLASLAHDA